MWRFLYTILFYFIQPIIWLFMLVRSFKASSYRHRQLERYGFYGKLNPPPANGILIHAASVGEVIAATPFIKKLQQQYPNLSLTVTTMTPTGSERVRDTFGDTVTNIYLPYDLPGSVKRFLNFLQPKACIVVETEIWPNLIAQCQQRDIPFIIINARLSARSAQRYGKIKKGISKILQQVTLVSAQDQVSADRYASLGVKPDHLQVGGNLKFDLNISSELEQKIQNFKQQIHLQRPIWVAGSTHEGEEQLILEAHKKLLNHYPDLLLIIAPRHPEHFAEVATLIEKDQLRYQRRSQQNQQQIDNSTQVLLADTMGELMLMYAIADIAFIGGSLITRGGHNPLEPLAFQIPVITGEHTFNFPEIFQKLKEVKGVIEIPANSNALFTTINELLQSSDLRHQYGQAGYQVLQQNRGALKRLIKNLQPYLEK